MADVESGTLSYYQREAGSYQELRARPVQAYTHEAELEVVRPHLFQGVRVLDLGCGEGRFSRSLAALDLRAKITGVDFSPGMIAEAEKQRFSGGPVFEVGDATNLRFAEDSFDVVFSATCLNNIPHIEKAIAEAHRVLAPGGVFIAVIINRQEWAARIRFVATAVLWLNRRLRKNGWFRRVYTQDEVRGLFEAHFADVHLRGLRLLPDLVPEFPFNVWRPLFPATRALLTRLKRLDEALTSKGFWAARARFHVVIARKQR